MLRDMYRAASRTLLQKRVDVGSPLARTRAPVPRGKRLYEQCLWHACIPDYGGRER